MFRRLLAAFLACLLLASCRDTVEGKSLAEPQVAAFHEQLAAKRYEEIYSGAGEEFQKAAPKEKVTELFAAINRKLGKVKSTSTKTWNVRSMNLKTMVVLVMETEFEQGQATETFTFRVSDGKAVLLGYNINSLDMMIR
jgi:hypothetical protein